MSTQPNRITPRERYTRFERRPSASNTLLAFSTCTRKLCSARLVKAHFPLIPLGQVGSAGIFISRS